MSVPPLLLGATLLFWGWLTGLLPVAVAGAVVLEGARLVRWRWESSTADLERLWDLCGVLYVIGLLWVTVTVEFGERVLKLVPWLPVIVLPFVVAVVYSAGDPVRPSTFFWFVRRRMRVLDTAGGVGRLVLPGYAALCLLSASAINTRGPWFYVGACLAGAWLAWGCRSRAVQPAIWLAAVAVAAVLGQQVYQGLNALQIVLENRAALLFTMLPAPDVDVVQSRTSIGSVGEQKASGRIVLRLRPERDQAPPALLRKASFSTYESSYRITTWSIAQKDLRAVAPETNATTWRLVEPTGGGSTSLVTIAVAAAPGMNVLAMPPGAFELRELAAGSLETNAYGTARVRETPPLLRYQAAAVDDLNRDGTPGAADLAVPASELAAVQQVATEFGLAEQPPAEVLRRVATGFAEKFTYRLYQRPRRGQWRRDDTPLRRFLLEDRAGHCEYFASAATLLLRAAGIPARYAVGFSVQEYSPSTRTYLVRARHAHAWTLAYIDGRWQEFDATPAGWNAVEGQQDSALQPAEDAVSWLWYAVAWYRSYGNPATAAKVLLGFAPVVLVWVGWRFFRRRARRRAATGAAVETAGPRPGLDSEFYRVEARLAKLGYPRRASESVGDWLRRLESAPPPRVVLAPLRDIAALHTAYRFDPQGLPGEQRAELRTRAAEWLREAGSGTGHRPG